MLEQRAGLTRDSELAHGNSQRQEVVDLFSEGQTVYRGMGRTDAEVTRVDGRVEGPQYIFRQLYWSFICASEAPDGPPEFALLGDADQ